MAFFFFELEFISLHFDGFCFWRPNRFGYGVKEEVDEHAFFSEPSGSVRGFSGSSSSLNHHQNESNWQLTMSCSDSSSKQRTCSALQTEHYPHLQLQNFTDSKRGEETQRTIHHFFDEGPPKDRESSWLDLDANNKSSNSGSASTTRLSISIPNSAHDFPIYNSRSHHGNYFLPLRLNWFALVLETWMWLLCNNKLMFCFVLQMTEQFLVLGFWIQGPKLVLTWCQLFFCVMSN